MLQHGGANKEPGCMIKAHQGICIITEFKSIHNIN